MTITDDIVGTMLVGSWMNLMLFTLEVTELVKYSKRSTSDSLGIKVVLAFMVFIDLVACVNGCAMVYLYSITNWGVPDFLATQNVTVPIYTTTTGLSTVCMHFFLIFRFFRLSKGVVKQYIYAPFLAMLALTAWSGNIFTVYSVIHLTALAQRPLLKTSVTLWLTTAAITDVGIALSLIWELGQLRGSTVFAESRSLLRRLIGRAIVTGSVTAILAVITLAFYLSRPTTNLCLTSALCIGRVCTITVLANLNSRRSQGGQDQSGEEYNMDHTKAGGITLTKSTVVRVDGMGDAPLNSRSRRVDSIQGLAGYDRDANSFKEEFV